MLTIQTENLTRTFGSFTAVNRLSIGVDEGEIFGFLGPNGAGKTTAIRMLCGLLAPTSGSGTVAGFDIMRETKKIRSRIGYMSQKFCLYGDLKMIDNLRVYGTLYGLRGRLLSQRIEQMSAFLHMENLLDRQTGTLPWGWQQRLSLACANLHEPRILFLDEPTGSVDPLSRKDFWQLIRELSRSGRTVFVTTHHMDEAEYCHRVSLMINGSVAAVDTPAKLKQHYDCDTLQEVFVRAAGGKKDDNS